MSSIYTRARRWIQPATKTGRDHQKSLDEPSSGHVRNPSYCEACALLWIRNRWVGAIIWIWILTQPPQQHIDDLNNYRSFESAALYICISPEFTYPWIQTFYNGMPRRYEANESKEQNVPTSFPRNLQLDRNMITHLKYSIIVTAL